MTQDIVGLIKEQLNENVLGRIAGFLGEEKSGVMSAVGSALPSLLFGLIRKGTEPGGAEDLLGILREGKHDGGVLDNLDSVLDGGSATENLLSSGKGLLASIFGDKAGGLGDMIASIGGISKNSGSSLLGILAPIVMGFIGKMLKSEGGFSAQGLINLLLGQKDTVKAALPAGVAGLLGVGDIEKPELEEVKAAVASERGIWPWVFLIIGLTLLFLLWRGCGIQAPKQEVTERVAQEASEKWAALGKFFSKKLPNGIELNIPELGVENKLITFIEDAQRPVDKTTWFSFDRLTFETGKATLKPESREQLKNIAEILKAYPKVTIKLGGYTDNVGDANANLKLSQQRAETVMADLVGMGIDTGRLEAEGYGQEHPIADNGTEEGRAKNRRIDMRVTGK